MKKENKKLAQERRAAERKKKELQAKIKKICSIGVPTLLILVLFVAIIVSSYNAKKASEEKAAKVPYLTDTSLTIEDGDVVNVDYVGYIDGVAFEGGDTKGNGTKITIGAGRYIDDFEEQLIGAHPGDTLEVNVTFPDNYGDEDVNGKDAVFEVVINGIYE